MRTLDEIQNEIDRLTNKYNDDYDRLTDELNKHKYQFYDDVDALYASHGRKFDQKAYKEVLKLIDYNFSIEDYKANKDQVKPVDINDVVFNYNGKHHNYNKLIKAECVRTKDGRYRVLAGSMLNPTVESYVSDAVKKRRKKANIKIIGSDYILQKDEEFDYPSTAAAFIAGLNVNGWEMFVTRDGKTLREWTFPKRFVGKASL